MLFSNTEVFYNPHKPLQGAFFYIQLKTGTIDIVAKQYVKVTISSTNESNWEIPIIKKDEKDSYFAPQDIDNSWYEVDLLDNYIRLNKYVIRANKNDYYREWDILGSLDGIDYFPVDHQENILKPSEYIHTSDYIIQHPKVIRVFRYCPKGTRYFGDHQLFIHRLELFGRFVNYKSPCSVVKCMQTNMQIYCYIFCLL